MRIVPPAKLHGERRCAVTGRTQDPEGFIETGFILTGWDNEVNLSIAAVKECARMVGWVSPEEIEDIKLNLATYAAKVTGLEEYVSKLEQREKLDSELAELAEVAV